MSISVKKYIQVCIYFEFKGLHSWHSTSIYLQVAQLSQRDRVAGWVSFGQKWKTGTGRQYFADTIGLSLTSVM